MIQFDTLEDAYIVSRWAYSVGEEVMDDASYNNLHRGLSAAGILPEYTGRSWSSDPCPTELLKKYNLEHLIYDIKLGDKTESIPTINSEAELEKYYKYYTYPVVVSLKIDGFNAQASYYNRVKHKLMTRGRKSDALDISSYLDHMVPEIPIDGETKVVGELVLSNEAFEKLKEMYPEKNLQSQRSAVRTALANKEASHLLEFIAFRIINEELSTLKANNMFFMLKRWGFKVPEPVVVYSYEELLEVIQNKSNTAPMYPFKTDGIVVASEDGEDLQAIRIGAWEEPIYQSIIEGYDESYGPHRIGVKLKIRPVKLKDSTQSKINITNFSRIVDLGLYPGTPVAFRLTSQAIADIDEQATKALQLQGYYDPSTIHVKSEGKKGLD